MREDPDAIKAMVDTIAETAKMTGVVHPFAVLLRAEPRDRVEPPLQLPAIARLKTPIGV